MEDGKILIGNSKDEEIVIYSKMANRHGMIAGATGTGKTVTLKVLAEGFSKMGVPVFLADVKGDLAPMCKAGLPVNFWDVYGEKGMPLRTTISEMGPLLLSRIMGLNDIQTDVLNVVFQIADNEGLLLIDTKDLKAMLQHVSENAKEYESEYGNIASATINAIIRGLVAIESEGAKEFFGEPALTINDWLTTDSNGNGTIQILDCAKLILHPKMYSTFLLWMMSELFEALPEVGDLEKPKMVFFFDEAHMLFDSAPKVLLDKIEQVVKLIRSKGVGIYFITQNPRDIPDGVLAQLGNKLQHALHAYTPNEQKGAKAASEAFRVNPEFDTYTVLQELGIGEALVSVLDESGIPTVVKRTKVRFPEELMGSLDASERMSVINSNVLLTKYDEAVDRDSAYEFLQRHKANVEEAKKEEALTLTQKKQLELKEQKKQKAINSAVKNVAKTTGSTIGRELGKTVGKSVGGNFGKRLGGNIGSSIGRGLMGTFFN